MIFDIIIMMILWVLVILFFRASHKEEDYAIASGICAVLLILLMIFTAGRKAGAKIETREIKTIIENPECYTYEEIESNNKRLLELQSYQGTIYSYHNNDDELRNLKPILPSTNDTSKVDINEWGNTEKK